MVALAGGWLWWPAQPRPAEAPPLVTAPPVAAPAPVAETSAAARPTAVPAVAMSSGALGSAAVPGGGPEFAIEPATEQDILDHVPPVGAPDPTIFRFMANPRILVLDFASLREQGLDAEPGRRVNREVRAFAQRGTERTRPWTRQFVPAEIRWRLTITATITAPRS